MTVLNRRPGIASVTSLGVLSLAMTVVQLAAPQWSERTGLDLWNYPGLVADERDIYARSDELDAHHVRLYEQVEAAEHIAELVIDQRLTLAEAVDRIARINEDRPTFEAGLNAAYPEVTGKRHTIAAYIMHKVKERLKHDSTRLAQVQVRLESEFLQLAE